MNVVNAIIAAVPPAVPQVLGILAVATFLLSYQQKRRGSIILLNVISRLLYILQYVLLGALSGAVLDILGALASVLAAKKSAPFFAKHGRALILSVNAVIVVVGLLLYEGWLSLLPIAGVLLHTGAFWLDEEKKIRRLSLLGSPFWFVYNFASCAYGSALGDLLTMLSILLAMARYRKDQKE
ncbi:MAG: YgjV family protein [Clostridia bacterium]|nr:YgjV family protein [Clostridia bacterium]